MIAEYMRDASADIHNQLQGILITTVGMAVFVTAMLLIPKMKRSIAPTLPEPAAA
jgi:hypothetical protein